MSELVGGMDFGYSRTHYYPGWIDGDYEEVRHRMQDDAMDKFLPVLRQMLCVKSESESEQRLLVGNNWPGIVITDEPSPGLVSKEE
jgi:hypothetical protein